MTAERADDVEPYVRGAAWPAATDAAYPRAELSDLRLPLDVHAAATIPVGVRLELVGDATAIEIRYHTSTAELGYRGSGAGQTFSAWSGDELLDEQPAILGSGAAVLQIGGAGSRVVVHLPEGMKPVVDSVRPIGGGSIEPAPRQPRWIAYGDSIVEGWCASAPALAWPAITARRHGLDVVNMGYAGAARGEIASAEQIAAIPAEVISLSFGTNCWSRLAHSADMLRSITTAFVRTVRAGHPDVPIVLSSPVVRPDAEATPNALGATLDELRRSMEDAASGSGDELLTLVRGGGVLDPAQLADGVHPGDDGHHRLATVLGGAVAGAIDPRHQGTAR